MACWSWAPLFRQVSPRLILRRALKFHGCGETCEAFECWKCFHDAFGRQHLVAQNQGGGLLQPPCRAVQVYSAYRLARACTSRGAPLAIINVGETRADASATLKVTGLAGEVLLRLAAHEAMLVPPG